MLRECLSLYMFVFGSVCAYVRVCLVSVLSVLSVCLFVLSVL